MKRKFTFLMLCYMASFFSSVVLAEVRVIRDSEGETLFNSLVHIFTTGTLERNETSWEFFVHRLSCSQTLLTQNPSPKIYAFTCFALVGEDVRNFSRWTEVAYLVGGHAEAVFDFLVEDQFFDIHCKRLRQYAIGSSKGFKECSIKSSQ